VLVGALTLHLAGALKHALVDRDGLLGRMWPWGERSSSRSVGAA
jgi:cytochrome b561